MRRLAAQLSLALVLALAGCTNPEDCSNGEDDDGDGEVDCADVDCDGQCDEDCTDARDNDGDGAVDCADEDCDGGCLEVCGDLRDNDGDGAIDCQDDECDGSCLEWCEDGRDNDGDGAIDCADLDCDGQCAEDCADGRDNDGDGLFDCEDGDCSAQLWCYESDCGDEDDEDGDGKVDCADDDCWGNGCAATIAWVTGGSAGLFRVRESNSWVGMSSDSGSTYSGYIWKQHTGAYVYSATGSLRAATASGAWATCTWTMPSAYLVAYAGAEWRYSGGSTSSSQLGYTKIDRFFPVLSTGCAHTTAAFLPMNWVPRGLYVGNLQGGQWYHGTTSGFSASTSTRTYSRTSPNVLSIDYYSGSAAWSIPYFAVGDPWVIHD